MDYQPNSHRYKEEQKQGSKEVRQINKVVTGPAKIKKKSELGKVASIFISEDAKNIKEYVLMDIIVPTLKKAIVGSVDMFLNGGRSTYDGRSSTSKISYRKYYEDKGIGYQSSLSESRTKSRFDYNDIIFATRADAEAVRDEMEAVIERYGFVTVADMYDIANLTEPYTSNKYGWYALRGSEVIRLRDGGYMLKLPKAEPLDR